jgi:hypothetical protein
MLDLLPSSENGRMTFTLLDLLGPSEPLILSVILVHSRQSRDVPSDHVSIDLPSINVFY